MHELYNQYINSKFGEPIEYSSYLDIFSLPHKIPRKLKSSRQYGEYLENLLEYLIYFFQRTEPLQDLDRIFSKVTTDFEEQWEIGMVKGWEVEAEENGHIPDQNMVIKLFDSCKTVAELMKVAPEKLKESLKLLSVMAAIRLDDEADNIKTSLSIALVNSVAGAGTTKSITSADPLTSSTWEKEANRRNNNWLPPPWAILALVVLGFNEFMTLLRNPLYLGVIFVAFLLMNALWVQLDITGEFRNGALLGLLSLSTKFLPTVINLLRKLAEEGTKPATPDNQRNTSLASPNFNNGVNANNEFSSSASSEVTTSNSGTEYSSPVKQE